jgi:hypothetical protein
MAFSIYQASVPVYTRQLTALAAILDKAIAYSSARKIDTSALVQTRLFPDMLPLGHQVRFACTHAVRGASRLTGAEPPKVEDTEKTLEDLKARVAGTLAFLKGIDAKKMEGMEDRDITFPAGDRKITMKGGEYLLHFSMPNFYFHVTTAYAILRHIGLEIGKDDFIGQAA